MKRYIDQDKCAVSDKKSISKTGAERTLLILFGKSLEFDGRKNKGTQVSMNCTLRMLEEDQVTFGSTYRMFTWFCYSLAWKR